MENYESEPFFKVKIIKQQYIVDLVRESEKNFETKFNIIMDKLEEIDVRLKKLESKKSYFC